MASQNGGLIKNAIAPDEVSGPSSANGNLGVVSCIAQQAQKAAARAASHRNEVGQMRAKLSTDGSQNCQDERSPAILLHAILDTTH